MGLILDLAVIALAATVVGSLALLAWTFAISSVHAVERELAQVMAWRARFDRTEARLRADAERLTASLADLASRTAPRRAAETDTDR